MAPRAAHLIVALAIAIATSVIPAAANADVEAQKAAPEPTTTAAPEPGSDPDERGDKIAKLIAEACRQKWQTDYQMQVHCRKEQLDAAMETLTLSYEILQPKFSEDEKAEMKQIMIRCHQKWSDPELAMGDFIHVDRVMALHCSKEQLAAFMTLRGVDQSN